MENALRAGVAIYNAGEYHDAHDAWERRWLDAADGTDDEQLLHGLIQFTAVVHHARRRNWSGAQRLATSAGEYLGGLPDDYRSVNVERVRAELARLAADPERIERRRPIRLTYDGKGLELADLDFEAAAVVARVRAEHDDRFDENRLDAGVGAAREELEDGHRTRYIALVMDFATGSDAERPVVYQRLCDHLERRTQKRRDVEGLFE
ncbi:hypothetical protein AUR64_06855 [Haloprofundus marisrubri]|uniref:DUF309 domain-containing protein n=1 Tax=Haloprofundus marisrubri TaxID=1514971 RepID=A0A0W1RCQ1_9EURY|nr:DUF309 domain-containing protein [Haloprofundus marisrubri]KTG10895.1 hypothetical protein AUR64_06855 [Haloprofundus marisrubri]